MNSDTIRTLFVHHSVGRYIIHHGRLRERLAGGAPDGRHFELWDHDYNKFGLSDGTGQRTGQAFPIPDDNTDPPGLVQLFSPEAGLRRELEQYDLILLKSCYPNNAIKTEEEFSQLQSCYQRLFGLLSDYEHTAFVLLTSPPLAPARTSRDEAARAKAMSDWLSGSALPKNTRIFNLFHLLAAADGTDAGMLLRNYRRWIPFDSHPNKAGCMAAASGLCQYLLTTPELMDV